MVHINDIFKSKFKKFEQKQLKNKGKLWQTLLESLLKAECIECVGNGNIFG